VVRWYGQKLDNRNQLHRDELRVRQFPGRQFGRVAVRDHWHDSGGLTAVRPAAVLGAAGQRDCRVRRYDHRDAIKRGRLTADRAARKHIHLQVVRQRQDRGRHTRTARHRPVQHRQLVRARVPGFRVVQPERREQR